MKEGAKVMKKSERIEWLNNRLFILSMKDHWTREDFDLDRQWTNELNELKKEV
jgi:hypothetical protein